MARARASRSALASDSGVVHRPAEKPFADWSVHTMQFHAGFGQPLLQVSDGHFAVVVEVGPSCEYLDRHETQTTRSR